MKNCQFCGHGNNDDMRFCLECGKPLPDAPIVFNIQDSGSQGQSGPGTNPYGQSMQTQINPRSYQQQQQQQPQFSAQQPQFSMVPPSKSRGSNKKIFIAIGGVIALLGLVILGIGGIVALNLMKDNGPIAQNSPTPKPSASPSASESPSSTPTPKPTEKDDEKDTKTPTSSDGSATSERIWVDYNVKEGGRSGMRIHATFTVYNLKGEDLYLALYFQKDDGTPLRTNNTQYASTDGQVAVFESLKPAYDQAYYEDVDLFIPYDEFKLSKGTYNLRIDASVIYKGGGRVDRLEYHDFEYEKF